MGRVRGAQVMMLGIAAAIAVFGTPIVAHGQALTCVPGTTTLVRAVGPQAAPMLVPAQVHAVKSCKATCNVSRTWKTWHWRMMAWKKPTLSRPVENCVSS